MAFEVPPIVRPQHTVTVKGNLLTRGDDFVIKGQDGEVPVTVGDIFRKIVDRGNMIGFEHQIVEVKFPNGFRKGYFVDEVEKFFVRPLT